MDPSEAIQNFGEMTFALSGGAMLVLVLGIIAFCVWALSDVPDEARMTADKDAPAAVRGYGCVNLITAVILAGVAIAIIGALLGGGK